MTVDELRDFKGSFGVYTAFKSDQDYYSLGFLAFGPYFYIDKNTLKDEYNYGYMQMGMWDENGIYMNCNEILSFKDKEDFKEIVRFVDKYQSLAESKKKLRCDEIDFMYEDILDDLNAIGHKFPLYINKKEVLLDSDMKKTLEQINKGLEADDRILVKVLNPSREKIIHAIKKYKYQEESAKRDI